MKKLENIPNKIKALVLHEIGKLTLDEINNYKLKEDWVLVKLKYCGICSSDIERVFISGTYTWLNGADHVTVHALIMFAIIHWSCASGGNKQRAE